MPGLTWALQLATRALDAQQGAINVTANNIANMNTDGYSRQIPILTEGAPVQEGELSYGSGVVFSGIQSVRDELLEMRIQQETQNKGYTSARLKTLQQINTLFSDTTSGIGAKLSAFYATLQSLSSTPTASTARTSVLTAANNLASAFNTTAQKLDDIATNLNLQVTEDVNKVNELTEQIADLNAQVSQAKAQGTDSSTLEDQRTELTRQLSELIDVNVVQTEQGPTLTTANGTALVVGDKSFALSTRDESDGTHVYLRGDDITSQLQGGHLGGVLNVRDNFIPGITAGLNQLASDFAAAFNKAHASSGSHATYDLNGDPGGNFFSATSAGNFAVTISDPSKIAASSSAVANETGSNGNVASLISAGDNLDSGGTPYSAITFYSSNLVFTIGNETYQAQSQDSTEELSLRQLQNQRNSVSGVSINEETANLLRYQHAYQAAARIVTTVDELTKTVLTMGAQ